MYNVLLTYPNEISLEVTEPEASRYEAVLAEPALEEDPTSDHPDIVDPCACALVTMLRF